MVQLKHDITPRNASRFAADVVAVTERLEGVTLDYSVESLAEIDRMFTDRALPAALTQRCADWGTDIEVAAA